jgi:hypothetical protein
MNLFRKKKNQTAPSQTDQKNDQNLSTSRISEPSPKPEEENQSMRELGSYLTEYHLTARFRYTEMGRREASLLLSILNYQSVHFGVNFEMYLSIDFLSSFLMGSKLNVTEIRNDWERVTVWSSLLILKDLEHEFITFSDRMVLRERTRKRILSSKLVMDKREYGSRFSKWRPEQFIELRAVPVDLFIERNRNSQRYDSYTKGYGEGSGSARRKKTGFSAELDGADERPLEFSLEFIQKYLDLVLIEEYLKATERAEN